MFEPQQFEAQMRSASLEVRQHYLNEAKAALADPRKLATEAFQSGMYLDDARKANEAIVQIIEGLNQADAEGQG